MLTLPPSVRIFLFSGPVDMRRGVDGLGAMIGAAHDLFESDLFVFISRRRDRCKILFWDRGGFVLYYKRLERGRFQLPNVRTSDAEVEMTSAELTMLLEGLDFSRVKKPKHWRPLKKSGAIVTRGIDKTIAV